MEYIAPDGTRMTERELDYQYSETLDDVYGTVEVAGYRYLTSSVLRETDEVAYRCGFLDWLDAEGYEEVTD